MHRGNPALAPGAIFEARYEILSELGVGGFGAVYKARQLTTGQAIALKVMRLDHGRAAQIEGRIARFLRETQLCAQLHHPNIVQLIDAGRCGDGLLYTVFSFAPGETLADLIAREGSLAPEEARHLMLQVLDALACAHAEGVVHRDLKPRNIMVIPTGVRRNAVVLDFGIGTVIARDEGEGWSRLTASGEAMGTPGYAAPEQLRELEISPGVDLFSWGLVLLECLTGKPVYTGGSVAEVLYAQLGPSPVPLPAALERHPLGALIREVTHKDAAARASDAREVFAALSACDLRGLSQGLLAADGRRAGADGPAPGSTTLENLPRATAPGANEPGAALAMEGEQRQLTAVCCALGVATTPPRAPDAEELDELLALQLGICADVAARHRGYVAAALGDRVLLYFGYPRAEEDDARRAARAALAITAALQAESDARAAQGIRLEARIGVHTGLVVAKDLGPSRGAGFALGATPRAAAQAAAGSPPGRVVVTAGARRLLQASFELGGAELCAVEGLDAPLEVIRLLGERSEPLPTWEHGGQKAPLVGRDQEIAVLLERWRKARRGAGQCSLITGEPGIGKSRLVRELRDRLAGEAHTFLECRCAPDTQHTPLYPIVELLGRALGLDQERLPRDKIARLEARLSGYGFALAEAAPLFLQLLSLPLGPPYAPLDVSPQRHKELTFNAILGLLFAMAEERALLFVAEDLHWADPTMLDLLEQLTREAPSSSAAMFVLLTARPELAPSFSPVEMLQLHLGRLDRPQIEAMTTALLGAKPLPALVLEQIAERTDGVPLFVEELLRTLVESGVLREREDRYELARPLSEVEIPSTLRDLLTARLDRLDRAKETAQLAAALGREFDLEVLSAMSQLPAAAVQGDLDRLVSAGLLCRKRQVAREPHYIFKHALVRDAAYESLPRCARRRVHALIARTLEERFPRLVEARPELLARHHAAAEQKRRAIGYALKAAQQALQRSAHPEALVHARGALGWLDALEQPRERAEAELTLNGVVTMALMSSKGYGAAEVSQTVKRSQELLDVVSGSPQAVPTMWAMFMYHHLRNDRADARALAERLLALARSTGDVGQEVATLPILGQCFYIEGRLEESRAALTRAVTLYDPAQHRGHALAYGLDSKAYAQLTLGLVLWLLGYPEQALAQGEAAVAWARQINHAATIGLALLYLIGIHHYQQDRARTIEATDALIEVVDRYGLSMIKAFGGILRGWAVQDPERSMREIEVLRASGQELGLSYWLSLVAESEAARQRYDRALDRLNECLRYAESTGELYYVPELHRMQGEYLLRLDPASVDAAEVCFRRSIAAARERGARMAELRSALALGRVLQGRGEGARAADLLRPIHGAFTEGFALPELQEARAALTEPPAAAAGTRRSTPMPRGQGDEQVTPSICIHMQGLGRDERGRCDQERTSKGETQWPFMKSSSPRR